MEYIKEFIEKARVMIEAWPYIKAFARKVIVVKTGGSVMENDADHMKEVLTDMAFMQGVNMLPVIVHGGGPTLSKHLKKTSIEFEFINGQRVTNQEAILEIRRVMNEKINRNYVRTLQELGVRAWGVCGEDIITADKKIEIDPENGASIDLGFVGVPSKVSLDIIQTMIQKEVIPVITPLGKGTDGQIYNINADLTAAAVAVALKARKLVYLSDIPRVLVDPNDPKTLISELRINEVEQLKRRGVLKGGMLPKIDSAINTLLAGVENVHFIDGGLRHALLLELFTDRGVGTKFFK